MVDHWLSNCPQILNRFLIKSGVSLLGEKMDWMEVGKMLSVMGRSPMNDCLIIDGQVRLTRWIMIGLDAAV